MVGCAVSLVYQDLLTSPARTFPLYFLLKTCWILPYISTKTSFGKTKKSHYDNIGMMLFSPKFTNIGPKQCD
eukprot:SAG11_NODE_496_length_8931_cov_2.956015_5_plen_72_part_00